MKKLLFLLLTFFFVFSLASCEMGGGSKTEDDAKELLINYYDNDKIIARLKYQDTIELYEYEKDKYQLVGWFLDKELTQPFDINNIEQYFKSKTMNLYVKMERAVEGHELQVVGMFEADETILDPIFVWQNNYDDNAYQVTLKQGEEIIAEAETEELVFKTTEFLQLNTEYDFFVLGKQSNYLSQIHFKTIATYNNNINTISLDNPFSDGMVMQRDKDVILSGVGPKYQAITVKVGSEEYYGASNKDGHFEVVMGKQEASFEPQNIVITNGFGVSKTLNNVLFGDVYLFAGQSNMQWSTIQSDYTEDDIAKLLNGNVRFFCQDVTTSTEKLESVKNGRWFTPDEYNCLSFSAIATMSGALLTSMVEDTPIGIITAYQGDTNIANWMGSEYYQGTTSTKYLHYNAMVYPLRHTKLSGVVWYQGCNNSAAGCEYKDLLLTLFANYRDLFNTEDLPFYVIGLACYDGDSGNNFDFSYVRESQAAACAQDDNAYFISTCDDGDPTYIHPRAKHYICERVAKSICSTVYHQNYYAEGPTYKSHTVAGSQVTIEFDNAVGLRNIGEIINFYLAGADGKYHEAIAQIVGDKIIAFSSQVPNPVYIKYGFGKSPFVNIFNKDNFSMVPFRTDNLNVNIDLFNYDDTKIYTYHPEGSAMHLALNNGNLQVTKLNDGRTYGSIRIHKWGAIAYQPEGFEFSIIGTNSNATISIRAIEGDSSEIWGYKIVDDFVGLKTFTVGVGDFIAVYNKQNNRFETQKISYVELMVEHSGQASFTLCNARFVEMERSAPLNFIISSLSENEDYISILSQQATFGETYKLSISTKDELIYEKEQSELLFNVDKTLFTLDVPYYVSITAKNELGETPAANNGYVFYLKDANKLIVCNFDFENQSALNAYMDSSMSVHSGLHCTLEEEGVRIESSGAGWQQFIFKLDSGAGKGMTKLQFKADFSNYHGTVVMQLADTNWATYSYNLNIQEMSEGTYTIDLSQFKNGQTPFTTQNLMWVMFNFMDNTGNGYILLDDVVLYK